MAFTIKALSQSRPIEVNDATSLMIELKAFAGQSVAVHCKTVHGMLQAHFLDIHQDGCATESYGAKAPVSAEYFKRFE